MKTYPDYGLNLLAVNGKVTLVSYVKIQLCYIKLKAKIYRTKIFGNKMYIPLYRTEKNLQLSILRPGIKYKMRIFLSKNKKQKMVKISNKATTITRAFSMSS